MDDVRIEYMPLSQLQKFPGNPKLHRTDAISRSMERFGYIDPFVIDEKTQRLVAGHGRLESLQAMKQVGKPPPGRVKMVDGEWMVPVIRGVGFKDDAEAEAYLLATNRLTEIGGWDIPALEAMTAKIDDDVFLADVGLTDQDLARLAEAANSASANEDANTPVAEDEPPEPPADADVYVKPGQIWELGAHRIICGDCTDQAVIKAIMGEVLANICWTDPPWNVAYGTTNGSDRQIANDDLGDAFPGFCAAFVGSIRASVRLGAPLYMAMSAQEWPVIDAALRAAGFHWSSTIIWAKDSLVLSRKDYHTQYEPIWYGWSGDAPRLVQVEDRKQSDVWNIDRPKKSELHPTTKPIELVARALKNSSHRGDFVFEPFSGSGTTIIAAEQTERRAIACEIEMKYVQVAIERWQALTGRKAKLIG